VEVKIKRVDKELPLPKFETPGSVGFDIYARETVVIKPNELVLVPTNLIIETPKNYMLMLAPRSSTYKRTGLILPNSVGIVDQDYCGEKDEILVQLLNIGAVEAEIKRGDRIAQGIFVKIDIADWAETDSVSKNSRGGVGSTGHRIVEN
jgi:dUTP pyrophosphatase